LALIISKTLLNLGYVSFKASFVTIAFLNLLGGRCL